MRAFVSVLPLLALACGPCNPGPDTDTDLPTGHTITFTNLCEETVWVGSTGNTGFSGLNGGGWEMVTKAVVTTTAPVGWSGRLWPRTGCAFDASGHCDPSTQPCCATGSCLESDNATFGISCGFPGKPPVTLAEMTFDAAGGWGPYDTYDLSMVDGWSVPMQIKPVQNTYNPAPDPGLQAPWCIPSGCAAVPTCPSGYDVPGSPSSCNSPCQVATNNGAADAAKYCCVCSTTSPIACGDADCMGGYGCSPYTVPAWPEDTTCNPWDSNPQRAWDASALFYIDTVRAACPKTYAWQFDDVAATFNCRKTGGLVDYEVTFCPYQITEGDI